MQPIHVLTNRYNNARIGVNPAESRLDVDNVNDSGFGKLFTRSVDGDLYAQPLLVSGMDIGGSTRNVVFLATSRNSVYAYDADDPEACLPLWSRNLGDPVPRDDVFKQLGQFNDHYLNFGSEIGITSTPAIARGRAGGILYVVAKTRAVSGLGGGVSRSYAQKIHALDLATGRDADVAGNPTAIRASARRSDGSTITFDPIFQLNRPGLLLHDGVLYLAFGSHTDIGEFYGWIMAYDAATLAQLAVYCTAPDWGEGGIWQSGCGLACDKDGYVYAVVGNGEKPSTYFQADQGGRVPDIARPGGIKQPVYGNCILKLKLTPPADGGGRRELKVEDWYTAPDVMDLNDRDTDLMSGPVVFETADGGDSSLKLVLGGGKDGRFYLLDRTKMGRWSPLTGGRPSKWDVPESRQADPGPVAKEWLPWKDGKRPANAVQDDRLCIYHIHGAPIIWKRPSVSEITAYVWSEKDALRAFRFGAGRFVDDRSDGFELQLLTLKKAEDLPAKGKREVILADVGGRLAFRIFDEDGRMAVDADEGKLAGRDAEIAELRARLEGLWPPGAPRVDDTVWIITRVVSIVWPDRPDRSTSEYRFPQDEMRMPGGFLALSADGDKDGTAIVWASHPTDDDAMNKTVRGTLRAYDARDLRKELWNSDQDAYGGDRVGNFAKFVPPVVANGKVYLATFSRELAVYGLFSEIGMQRLINSAGIFELRGFGGNVDAKCTSACDRYDLVASGGRFQGKADSFAFAYRVIDLKEQPRITITALLSGINTIPAATDHPDARAGIMIRKFDEDADVPGLAYAALVVTAGRNGATVDNDLFFLSRNDDGKNGKQSGKGKRKVPLWLRLLCEQRDPKQNRVRFTAEVSEDGITWTPAGEEEMPMDGRVMVGLAAASQVDPKAEAPPKVQARFTNVLITPAT